MNLIEALKTPPRRHRTDGPGREIRAWIDTLTPDEQEAVINAAKDPAWGHRALLELLVSAGMPTTSDNTLRSWRTTMGWTNGR